MEDSRHHDAFFDTVDEGLAGIIFGTITFDLRVSKFTNQNLKLRSLIYIFIAVVLSTS
jgi:hypothetical protein